MQEGPGGDPHENEDEEARIIHVVSRAHSVIISQT